MRAGTITLRIGERLVAIAADTDATLTMLRDRFGEWVDDTQPDIEVAFDLRLDTSPPSPPADGGIATAGRSPRSVPQLRHGSRVMARSRSADDVVDALDTVLGGVLAHQDDSRIWLWLRPFVTDDRVVLVDATRPMLVNDPKLARQRVDEVPTWAVALSPSPGDEPPTMCVPGPLSGPDGERRFRLAGFVGVTSEASATDAAHLSRYGAMHAAPDWFRTVHSLIVEQQLRTARDRRDARSLIVELLH